jgi:hypothetical protein
MPNKEKKIKKLEERIQDILIEFQNEEISILVAKIKLRQLHE